MATWGNYERLRPGQIEAIRAATPIAYVPWGALEWHSYHNPIGLDGIKAHGLCEALAQEVGGVVLPPFYVGTDTIKPFKGFQHTIEHAETTVAALCLELLAGLADEGFTAVVIVTGHYGGRHVETLRAAVATYAVDNPALKVWMLPDWEAHQGVYSPNHAAFGETSYQLHFDPETVDLSLLPADRVTTLDDDGVWGDDPRLATAADGAKMLAVFLEQAVPKVKALL